MCNWKDKIGPRTSAGHEADLQKLFRNHFGFYQIEPACKCKKEKSSCVEVSAIIYTPWSRIYKTPGPIPRGPPPSQPLRGKNKEVPALQPLHRRRRDSQLSLSDHDTVGIPIDLANLDLDGVVVERLVELVGIALLALGLADAIPLDGEEGDKRLALALKGGEEG